MPETRRHLGLRTALFQILEAAFADRAVIGSEQFLYWDPTDPKACVAPDVMVRLGEPDAPFDSWKVWERGAPQLAIEVISKSDADYAPWERKLERYRHVGVKELVRFDPDDTEAPLRIWDLVDGDAVERDRALAGFLECRTLGVFFCLRQDEKLGIMLRFARDVAGTELLLTPREARLVAEARVRELEAELARRG